MRASRARYLSGRLCEEHARVGRGPSLARPRLLPSRAERRSGSPGLYFMPSTVIAQFTYDRERRDLVIVFRSGRIYAYHDVPADVAAAMRAAFAKGEFFNAEIRDRYCFTRLAPSGESVRKVTE
jgi:hypothetical protein